MVAGKVERKATHRIFCIDQLMKSSVPVSSVMVFGGSLVRAVADGCQYGKRQHGHRDMTMPAVPRTDFVMVKIQFDFGSFE